MTYIILSYIVWWEMLWTLGGNQICGSKNMANLLHTWYPQKKRSIDSMMIPAMCKSLKWLNHVCNIITSYHIIYNIYKQMIRSPPRQKKFTLCWRTSTRCASYTSMAGITLARPPENCPVGDPGCPRSHKGGWRQGNDHVNVCESCLMFVVRHIMD